MAIKGKGARQALSQTKGLGLSERQIRSVQKQINAGKVPKVTVLGERVTLPQIRQAQRLITLSEREKSTAPVERLRYKNGVATTKAGVKITKAEAKLLRTRLAQAEKYARREQYRATLRNVRSINERESSPERQVYPSTARRRPISVPQRFDPSKFKNQEAYQRYVERILNLYDPETKSSPRHAYLNWVLRDNWILAIEKQLGDAANEIVELARRVPPDKFAELVDRDELPTVGDVYYGLSDEELNEISEEIKSVLEEAAEDEEAEADYADVWGDDV